MIQINATAHAAAYYRNDSTANCLRDEDNGMIMKVPFVSAVLLVMAACSGPTATDDLNSRLITELAPADPCNSSVTAEYLSEGARIRISEATLFVSGRTDLTDCGRDILVNVVQAMLKPSIMAVVIEPDAGSGSLSLQRADVLAKMLSHVGFVPQPPVVVAPTTTAPGGSFEIVLSVFNDG